MAFQVTIEAKKAKFIALVFLATILIQTSNMLITFRQFAYGIHPKSTHSNPQNATSNQLLSAFENETMSWLGWLQTHWVDFSQAIGGLATAGTLVFVGYQTMLTRKQTRQTQEQMDAKLRPWVGNVDDKSPSIWTNEQIVSVYLTNWGDIPASPCDMKGIITANKIRKEDIFALEPTEGGLIMPKREYEWRIQNDDEVPIPMTEADQFFVGFLIEYGFGISKEARRHGISKKGTFGFVARYELPSRDFIFDEYWAS